MTQPDALFLRHMLDAIDRVIEATTRTSREEFDQEWMVQDAIIHQLQILGEAAGRVSQGLVTREPQIPWRKITGLRHKVVHDYFVVDLDIIWDTATIDVPSVRPLIQTLLDDIAK